MIEQKESPPVVTTPKLSTADEVRLKRLGLWYLRDNPQALAIELERVERVTKTAPKSQ
jgi:hypothetical protein